MIKFLPLGSAGEIGATCFYLNINGTGIILDCGMHPQKKGIEALPDFDIINNMSVDYVLISHAHQDHLDSLPYLVQRHPYIRIITTPQTRAIAELTLHNSVSIMEENIQINEIKIYSHEEIDLLIQTIEYKAYKEEFIINGYDHIGSENITASFHDAGHIIGSAGILIKYKNKKIFFTGDINMEDQSLQPAAELPSERIDILISECTYGSTESKTLNSWKEETLSFAEAANKILNKGGSILIPVFSLGKAQEMLAMIWKLILKGKLADTNIYTGGLSTKISRVYDYNRFVVNRIDPEFELKSIPQKNLYEINKPSDLFKESCIVLASSGMMVERTASFNLAKTWITQKDSAIFVVGYMDPNTPGFRVSNSYKGGKIKFSDFDEERDVKCEIKKFRFSAHSKREGLLRIVKKLKPENVILVHGDPPSIDWMGSSILKELKNTKVFAAEAGKEILFFDKK